MQKISRFGLWWPIIHNDAKYFGKACDISQRIEISFRRGEMPLSAQVTLQEFNKRVVDFVGPMNPK